MALTYYEQALQEIDEEDDSDRATTLNNIGTIFKAMGQREEALEQYEQALRLQEEIGDRNGQSVTLNNLGMLYSTGRKRNKALELYAQAWRIQKEIGDYNGEGVTLNNIGILYYDQSRYRYALACFLEARRILEVAQSPDRESTQESINMIQRKIGEEMFEPLVKEIQPQARQIVEQALLGDLKSL